MKKGEVLYKHVKISDSVPISKLGVLDMLRAIIEKMNYDPAERFKSDSTITEHMNTLQANCIKFLKKSIKPIQNGVKDNVLINLSSKFLPVYEDVKNSTLFEPYYDFEEAFPETTYPGVPFKIRVLIARKSEEDMQNRRRGKEMNEQ